MGRRAVPRPWEEAYRTQGRLWRGARLDPLTRSVLERWPETRDAYWLEVGCGDGKGLVPLAQALPRPARLVGADRSVWGLRLARGAARDQGVHDMRLVRGDARAWPFRDGCAGVVRAVHLVGHLTSDARARAAQECARLLRPGGLLLLSEFGVGDFRFGQGDEVEPGTFRRGVGIRTHYFEAGELRELIEAAGLRIVTLEAQRFAVDYDGVQRARERWDLVARA